MSDVVESDWKLFRKRLPQWQENYMEKLVHEYMEILSSEDRASEKFWTLDERLQKDKKCPGVVIYNARRSSMHTEIARLVHDGVIDMDDLEGFSEDVTGYIEHMKKWWKDDD